MGRKRRSGHNLVGVAAADEYGASDSLAKPMNRRSINNHDFKGIRCHSEVKFDETPKPNNVVIDDDHDGKLEPDYRKNLNCSSFDDGDACYHHSAVNTTAQNGSGGVELVEESVDFVNSYNEKSSEIDNYFDEDFKYYLDHYVLVPSDVSDHSIDHVDNIASNINPVNQSTGNCVHVRDIDSDFDEDYKNYLDGYANQSMENCVMDSDFDEDYRNYLYGHVLVSSDDSDHSNSIDHADDIAANSSPINQSMGNCSSGNSSREKGTSDVGLETKSLSIDHDDNLDGMDPHYMTFLDSVTKHQTSYEPEVPGNDGSEVLTYEKYGTHNIVDDGQREIMMRLNEDAASATKHVGRCNELDSCYSTFLSLLKREGGDWVLRLESGEEVVYEEDERSSSDSEVIMMDTDPFAGETYTPFVTSKAQLYDITDDDDAGCLKSSSTNEHSKFRENLIEILKKPFDEEECYLLWTEVRQKKPVKVEKDMRGGRTRSFLSEMNAPSYCDLHEDLDRSIEQAGCNKPKILNILRGFFYWLQNVAHDGVFKPWTDSSCLEVLPSVPGAALERYKNES